MNLIPTWREVSLDTHSMRFLWAAGWSTLYLPEIAYVLAGRDVTSPYATGFVFALFWIAIWLGRVLDQGIASGRRDKLPSLPIRIAWFTVFPLAMFGAILLLSRVM